MKATVNKRLNKRNFTSAEGNEPLPTPHEPGDIIEVVEELQGSVVKGTNNDIWFKTDKGYYVWSGGVNISTIEPRPKSNSLSKFRDETNKNSASLSDGFTSQLEEFNNLPKTTGKGVTVFVLDSGIDSNNYLFKKQVIHHWDEVLKEKLISNSHGTRIASVLIGGKDSIIGISPKIEIISLKVIRESKQPKLDAIKGGIEFIKNFCSPENRYIVNLSFSISYDPETFDFFTKTVDYFNNLKIPVIVAGNKNDSKIANPLADIPGTISVAVLPSALESLNQYSLYFNNEPLITTGINNSTEEFKNSSAYTAVVSGITARILEKENRRLTKNELLGKFKEISEGLPTNQIFKNFKLYQP